MNQQQILKELQKFPNKSFGQNFLTDEKVLFDIVESANIEEEDTVVEIGPGLGVLTKELCKLAKKVIAIELDYELAEYLRRQNIPNLTVVTGNALDIDWTIDIQGNYKIVANIPYSITSPLLRKIFALNSKPSSVVLLVQKELAERITAPAGRSDRGYLTLITEANAETKIIRTVKPGSFYPQPKVDSAVISIIPKPVSQMEQIFWPAVEAGFRHKRQTLANAISKDLHIPKGKVENLIIELGLDPLVRPAVLTFEQWVSLSNKINT